MSPVTDLHRLQQLLARIPRGKVTTYKELGREMGTKGYRYIGHLLHINPEPERYPCYKVVNADGRLGGFAHGPAEKIRRLKADGIELKNGKVIHFDQILYRFK